VAAGQHHEAMVAIDKSGTQIAWTLMCSPSATAVIKEFMFLPLMESGSQTGLIACVGVDEAWRNKGIASILLSEAIMNMRGRNVTGVFIDWVTIQGYTSRWDSRLSMSMSITLGEDIWLIERDGSITRYGSIKQLRLSQSWWSILTAPASLVIHPRI
jgi:hypothetical protein